MQPDGPYRFTEVMGVCQVGRAWWAVDGQDRLVTVAVLEPVVAEDPAWRRAFSAMADALAAPGGGGGPYLAADFTAAAPWVAYAADGGPGADRLFLALGHEIHSEEAGEDSTVAMLQVPQSQPAPWAVQGDPTQVSAPPQPAPPQPVSTPPVSTPPHQAAPPPVSAPPQPVATPPVSAPPQPFSTPPYPVSTPPHQVSGPPVSPAYPHPTSVPPYDPLASTARRIQPSEPRRRRTGLWLGIVALVLVVLAAAGGVAVWAGSDDGEGSPPPYTLEERAVAVASPSLVYVEVVFTGYLRDKRTGAPLRAAPITFNRRCSGFVVSPAGHVLTNGFCVRPTGDTPRQNALYALGRVLIQEKKLEPGKLDGYVAQQLKTTVLTGVDAAKEPEVRLFGQVNVAKGNVTDAPAIPGEIVRTWEPQAGNVALVKLAQDNLPVAELNPAADLKDGTTLLSIGYGTTDKDPLTATFTVQSKRVTVTGSGTSGTMPVSRVNDDVGLYSRGGLAVDTNGRVVGILDNDEELPTKANRIVVPASTLDAMLTEAGVTDELGDTDKLYRSGLDDYFAGRYSDAITRLEAVAAKSPANLVAQTYRQNAVDRQKIGAGD
ncbi:trypsin-like peptidase domain-containing protein [Micromonospora purpureochromogenes]|uniref:trypsin-like peptidase domain-containing protein n=1 Tax=Micromonospora purpureochromogenes TaxID=47872 RepID=UPI0033FF1882